MTFVEQAQLAEDGEFQARVRQAAITAAVGVMAERPANTPQAIERHRLRAEFGRRLLNEPTSQQRALTMSVVSNPGIVGATATDADVQFTVNSMWDSWAGVILDPEIA
jgi:hypothetical protein